MLLKKSKKIVLIIIALAIIGLAFLGGHAYAKYMSRIEGMGAAEIANWSFKANENTEKLQTISLKSTVDNTKVTSNKLAPGTKGKFEIKLDATKSEVGVNYIIRFENESIKPTNLKFSYNGKTYNSLTDLGTAINGIINANDENKTKTIQVEWNWAYQTGTTAEEITANDLIDTQDSRTIENYNFDVIVTGTQVNPEI